MRPYGRYQHGNSRHPREQHLAWDGMVIPLDDSWWTYRWPPNGWGCQCSVVSASEREIRTNGWKVSRPEPDKTIKVTVNTPDGPMEVETVEGLDPSFAYNPGKSATGSRMKMGRGLCQSLHNIHAPKLPTKNVPKRKKALARSQVP